MALVAACAPFLTVMLKFAVLFRKKYQTVKMRLTIKTFKKKKFQHF